MKNAVIEQISSATTWYIRHKVLWPDKPFDFVMIANDADGTHWAIYENHKQAGVISLFVEETEAQFRKFAVLPEFQGKGLGTMLLAHVFIEAQKLGATSIWCDARQNATSLYKRFGMEQVGDEFLKEDILYVKMKKVFEF